MVSDYRSSKDNIEFGETDMSDDPTIRIPPLTPNLERVELPWATSNVRFERDLRAAREYYRETQTYFQPRARDEQQ